MSKREREFEVTCLRRVGRGFAAEIDGVPGEVALTPECGDLPTLGHAGRVRLTDAIARRLGLQGPVGDTEEWDPEITPAPHADQWRQAAETNARVAACQAGGGVLRDAHSGELLAERGA